MQTAKVGWKRKLPNILLCQMTIPGLTIFMAGGKVMYSMFQLKSENRQIFANYRDRKFPP